MSANSVAEIASVGSRVENLTSNDIISCLWSKNSTEKCRIGLADAVIYENGVPMRWYVTGKAGEVVKKRGIELNMISQRWTKINSQSDSNIIAILRQSNGIYKFLSEEAWKSFILNGNHNDVSILSLHCFIKGDNYMVYRNKFRLKDTMGRFTTTTHSYVLNINKDNNQSVYIQYEHEIKLTEIRANQIRNILDLATNTVMRYLEMMLNIKIISITIDYVIDSKSQIWMLWSTDTRFSRTSSLDQANIPELSESVDKVGRDSWLGPKYFELVEDNAYELSKTDLKSEALSSTITRTTRGEPYVPQEVNNDVVAMQLVSAEKVHGIQEKSKLKRISNLESLMNNSTPAFAVAQADESKIFPDGAVSPHKEHDKFPHAFKCKGDYCNILIKPAVSDLVANSTVTSLHVTQKLFSEKEILQLRKDKKFAQMMEFGSTGPALAALSMKNIILARQERRGLNTEKSGTNSWKNYPVSPRSKMTFKESLSLSLQNKGEDAEAKQNDDFIHQKDIEKVLEHDKEQRESFTKSMASYYEQVRVCGVCYNIYNCLDWAREILGQGDAYGAGLEGMGAAYPKVSSANQRSRPRIRNTDGMDGSVANELSLLTNPTDLQENSLDSLKSLKNSLEVKIEKSVNQSPSGSPTRKFDSPSRRFGSPPDSPSRLSKSSKQSRSSLKTDSKATWKDHITTTKKKESQKVSNAKSVSGEKFLELDDYLRSGANAMAARKKKDKLSKTIDLEDSVVSDDESKSLRSTSIANAYKGKVLFACEDNSYAKEAVDILEDAAFDVYWVKDGRQAVNDFIMKEGFDCVLVQRDLALSDAFKVTKSIRDYERSQRKHASAKAAMSGIGIAPEVRRHPVICYSSLTSPEDLKLYMKADMDGCVSYPVNKISLLNTVRAAIPHHLANVSNTDQSVASQSSQSNSRVYKLGPLGELEGSDDSSTRAANTLPVSSKAEEDVAFNGIVQIDADTRVPFMVMDASRTAKVILNPKKPFFNLVVCHDLFDTAEKLKIFLRPMVQRYLGMQVLLWNYPGQAFTEWRPEQLLNNEYLATCLNEVLGQVGEKGTKDFDTSRPFYLLGYGNGANIASFYASHYRVPNLRGLINVNGWSFVDSYLAGIMHDCINIFQCSPPSRPDLPIYFFSRFLFSKDYLNKVSVPLALNLYTAVHNSISIPGRLSLCKGVLQSVDLRPILKEIDCPIICLHSTQDAFARPLHAEPFVTHRAGEVRSIYKVLQNPRKTCVIWSKGGHEVFQENKKPTQLIIEQILTGFHETHDISFPAAPSVDPTGAAQGKLVSSLPWESGSVVGNKNTEKTVEDKFIDNVLNSMKKLNVTEPTNRNQRNNSSPTSISKDGNSILSSTAPSVLNNNTSPGRNANNNNNVQFSSTDPSVWNEYSTTISKSQILGRAESSTGKRGNKSNSEIPQRTIDPSSSMFEKQDKSIYSTKSMENKQNLNEYPEVKEYMSWRLKRNKKRLQRLQIAAKSIQGAFRAYLARKFIRGVRRYKASIVIQRIFRGWLGRCEFQRRTSSQWAAMIIQRTYRGYLGRKWYFYARLRIAAAADIQRIFRGYRAKLRVARIRRRRYIAASLIQALMRRYLARKDAWRRRQFKASATAIQRMFRGFLGRMRAATERDRYIFSRSQSQGIEFGRQMLLEHKLHATKLQSDVTLLTQEKVSAEEQIEALLEEISSFEEGVRVLEKEMHQLSKIESEAAAFMDADSKFELREQKIKLDKEFGDMLGKIGNRKDMLNELERKLGSIDKSRQSKEEELRTLERKLVVLLEEQQNELNAIKRKQDVRGAMLAASHQELMKITASESSNGGSGDNNKLVVGGGGGGGGGGGPSLQEKKQAAQLMQSTETLMKFGFMSMSMTYFSSLNMIKALRTVSAQDTVMAALADVHAQRAVNFDGSVGGGGGGGGSVVSNNDSSSQSVGKPNFLPGLKPGQLSGQESLRVSAWSVDDVSKWLQALSLGQYSEAFNDAAIDGEFLFDLNDDDLKNTLGIEHRLHRKKILNCVHRLKVAEVQKDNRLNELLKETGSMDAPVIAPDEDETQNFPKNPFKPNEGNDTSAEEDRMMMDGPKIPLSELFSLVRHSKLSLIKDAIDYMPNKNFDKALVQAAYANDHGTVYASGYERLPFHLNKTDEFGNTMLSLACQNGNIKLCKYLAAKGANLNHQNRNGQTPAHFAIAYKFFDLSHWLFENGADDTIHNKAGLSPYDGLDNGGGDDLLEIEN